MAQLMEDIANGNGLSRLGKMLNFDDTEFCKGALIGAAAMLLLTTETVQGALFKTGVEMGKIGVVVGLCGAGAANIGRRRNSYLLAE